MRFLLSTTLACAALLFASTAQADPGVHDGFYMQLNGGLGYFSTTAEAGGVEASYSGVTVPTSLLLGGSFMPGLTIGGGFLLDYAPSPTWEQNGTELDVSAQNVSQYVLGLGLFGDYYLEPTGGLHFQGFVGWGGLETSSDAGAGGSDPTGLSAYLGGGYDVFIADEWSVGGMVRLVYGPYSLNNFDYPTIAPAMIATLTYQ